MTTAESTHGIVDALLDLAEPVGSLKPYPHNARRHNLPALAESLRFHGQYRPLIANRTTGHILKGNGTYRTCVDVLGWTHVAVSWVEIPAADEARYVAVDNRTSELGWNNDAALLDVLSNLGDLSGTSYVTDDIDMLQKSLAGGYTPLPPPASDPDKMERDKKKYDLAETLALVLVAAPAEYDQLLTDLDTLAAEGESPADVVLRLVSRAAAARGLV